MGITSPAEHSPAAQSHLDLDNMKGLVEELNHVIEGDVRFDAKAQSLYATDASPYEIKPFGVVLPKHNADIAHTMRLCAKYQVPITARGGGTSLAGQTVGEGVILDISKYLTKIIDFDPDRKTVKVEPGVVRDDLNEFLKPFKLQFTPDVSTTNRANIGGMVANNSAGTRSIKYGKSVDQTLAMTVMLADGSVVELRDVEVEELEQKKSQNDCEGHIYRTVSTLTQTLAPEIDARFPKVMRRVGGYNLDEFITGKPFNLAKLVSGSEGTLAIILDVTLQLYSVPEKRVLALLHYRTLDEALQAVPAINLYGPSAVELIDTPMVELARANPALQELTDWVQGNPGGILLVEFDGDDDAALQQSLTALQNDATAQRGVYHTHLATTLEAMERVLELRRRGLGIYATIKGAQKPTPFVEDAAIPPENLAAYAKELQQLCQDLGVPSVYYGHASVGVIHTRPLLDMKTDVGVEQYRQISHKTFELVKKYGGSWSGEHGDGLIRSYKNRELFGDTLYEAFRDIKAAFDPDNLLNPGKIVDSLSLTDNLRYGASYSTPHLPEKTYFDFSENEGFLGAVEACTGVGACRKVGTGTMCPSFMATRDEDHSTRGRANILREAITGQLPGGLTSHEVYDVLDLCLECKACKNECPSKVDMAKVKYEFLAQYYDAHGVPLSARAVASTPKVAPLGSFFAPIANALLPLKPMRLLIEKLAKVDARRVLPLYERQSFAQWFKRRTKQAPETPKRVALFADTWTMYNETSVGKAAVEVLEACGYQVELVPYGCCGRPQISKGILREAKKIAAHNVDKLYAYVEAGVPVVGLEPSCVASFQDDYRDLAPSDKAVAVAKHVMMIDQFLAKQWTQGELSPETVFEKRPSNIMLHGHCQQKALMGSAATNAVLSWTSNDVHEVDSGCCGMAGSFGYGHYNVSMTIGEQRLFPAVREQSEKEGGTVACGFSCRHQIKDGTGAKAKHVTEVLAAALKDRRA